ncbi:MAG: hypothetical protein KDE08_16020 [Rhodobacteraceae bacterium]|nr:hypothetical protein [Paracoccaceae bacterium]
MSTAEDRLAEARRLMADGRDADALDVLDAGLAVIPAHFGLALARTSLLRRWGRMEAFRQALAGLVALHPGKPGVLIEQAAEAQSRGDDAAAEAFLDAALAIKPDHGGALAAKAEIDLRRVLVAVKACQDRGDETALLAMLESETARYPDAFPLWLARTATLRRQGRADAHRAAADELAARFPDRPGTLQELTEAARLSRNFAAAHRHLAELEARWPDHGSLPLSAAALAEDQANYDLALTCLDRINSPEGDELWLARRRSALLRQMGRTADYRAALADLHLRFPDDAETLRQLVRVTLTADPEAAQASLAALRRLDPEAPQTRVLDLMAATAARDKRAALALEETMHGADNPAIAVARAQLWLQLADPARAIAVLDRVQDENGVDAPVRMARAAALMASGDYRAAGAEYLAVVKAGGLHAEAIAGRIRAAVKEAAHPGLAGDAVAEMGAEIDRWRIANGHRGTARFRAELARAAGDWAALCAAASEWSTEQPRDMRARLLLGIGHLGMGNVDASLDSAADCLAQDPNDNLTLQLADRLSLLSSRMTAPESDGLHQEREIVALRDLFHLDRSEDALAALERLRLRTGEFPNVELAYELQLQGRGSEAAALQPEVPPAGQSGVAAACDPAVFRRMFDLSAGAETFPDMPEPAAEIGYRLCGAPDGGFAAWRDRAVQASEANRALWLSPMQPADLEPLIDWPPLDELLALSALGKPALMVSSHLGPFVHNALLARVPGLHYLMMRGPQDPPPSEALGNWTLFDGNAGASAAGLFRALRQGRFVISLPDVPAGFSRRGQAGARARGRLFGIGCEIVDTVPKLAREMALPVFWVQPLWNGDRIRLVVDRMPGPEADEDGQAWADRWAADYLDRVAAVIASGPDNQDFRAPIWRFLLLNAEMLELPPVRLL